MCQIAGLPDRRILRTARFIHKQEATGQTIQWVTLSCEREKNGLIQMSDKVGTFYSEKENSGSQISSFSYEGKADLKSSFRIPYLLSNGKG